MVNWQNPYENTTHLWLKGNLHTHTTPQSPCGRVELPRVLEKYEEEGYDFLSISDHQIYTEVNIPTRLIIIPGLEWNSRSKSQEREVVNYREHLGIYSINGEHLSSSLEYYEPENTIAALSNNNTLVVLNHPNWLVPHHYSEEMLFKLSEGCDGLEIYNAVIDRHPGVADATMKWDRLLTDKGPMLGFASDDSHFESDIGKASIIVNVEVTTPENLFNSIKQGKFYCSTGVTIKEISRSGSLVQCQATGEDVTIEAVGENGQIYEIANYKLCVDLEKIGTNYIRFTLYGKGREKAWTQPFYK